MFKKGSVNHLKSRHKLFYKYVLPSFLCFAIILGQFGSVALADSYVTFDPSSITNTSLGDVAQYGVFARTYDINNDLEANVAVEQYLRSSAHSMGTSVEKVVGSNETYCYINNLGLPSEGGQNWPSEWTVHSNIDLFVIGDNYDIFRGSASAPAAYNLSGGDQNSWYVAKKGTTVAYKFAPLNRITSLVNASNPLAYKIDFTKAFTNLSSLASSIGDYAIAHDTNTTNLDQFYKKDKWDQNTEGINCHEGMNVYNIPVQKLTKNSYVSFDFRNLDSAKTVIINVDMTGYKGDSISIMKNMNTPSSWSPSIGKILWNFGNFAGTVNLGATRGTVLAPKARVIVNNTSDGTIIANYVQNTNGEIHKNDFIGDIPVTPTPTDFKLIYHRYPRQLKDGDDRKNLKDPKDEYFAGTNAEYTNEVKIPQGPYQYGKIFTGWTGYNDLTQTVIPDSKIREIAPTVPVSEYNPTYAGRTVSITINDGKTTTTKDYPINSEVKVKAVIPVGKIFGGWAAEDTGYGSVKSVGNKYRVACYESCFSFIASHDTKISPMLYDSVEQLKEKGPQRAETRVTDVLYGSGVDQKNFKVGVLTVTADRLVPRGMKILEFGTLISHDYNEVADGTRALREGKATIDSVKCESRKYYVVQSTQNNESYRIGSLAFYVQVKKTDTVYARSYVKYVDADGNTQFEDSFLQRIDVKDVKPIK